MGASRSRAVIAAAVASVVLCGGAGLPLAQAAPALAKKPHIQTPAEAREADLRAIATAAGWTMAEVRAYQRSVDAVHAVIGRIVDRYPGILVGSRIADDPLGPPTIYLKGPSDPDIEAMVAAAGVPIVVVADLPYSMDELEDRSIRAHEAVLGLGIPFVSTGTDPSGRIPMSIARNGGFTDADLAAIGDVLPEDVRADVDLTVVAPPIDALLCPAEAPGPSPAPSFEASPSVAPSSAPASPVVRTVPRCIDVPPGWGPLAVVDDPAMESLDGGTAPGRIYITERCVVFRGKQGPGVTLVWRAGDTRWDPSTDEVLFVDPHEGLLRLRDGDRVTLGGYSPDPTAGEDERPRLAPWLAQLDPSCPSALWAVHGVSRADGR
jgi:hypothetical protein